MLWTVLYIVGSLVGLFMLLMLILWVLGRRVPEEHVATMRLDLKARPEAVWQLISKIEDFPSWAAGVTKVVRLGDPAQGGGGGGKGFPDSVAGQYTVRMHMGRNSFVLRTTTYRPPGQEESEAAAGVLIREILDDKGPFTGTWEYRVVRASAGTTKLMLTERGRVSQAIPRACMKYLLGYYLYIRKHLTSLAVKLGDSGVPFVGENGGKQSP
jgi:hypothetical protein